MLCCGLTSDCACRSPGDGLLSKHEAPCIFSSVDLTLHAPANQQPRPPPSGVNVNQQHHHCVGQLSVQLWMLSTATSVIAPAREGHRMCVWVPLHVLRDSVLGQHTCTRWQLCWRFLHFEVISSDLLWLFATHALCLLMCCNNNSDDSYNQPAVCCLSAINTERHAGAGIGGTACALLLLHNNNSHITCCANDMRLNCQHLAFSSFHVTRTSLLHSFTHTHHSFALLLPSASASTAAATPKEGTSVKCHTF